MTTSVVRAETCGRRWKACRTSSIPSGWMVRAWPSASVPSIQCRLCAESTGMLSYGHFVQFLRGENVQNLFYVFRHQRQMPLARVIVSVAVWNGRGHVVPHRGRGIGVRLVMPKLDCHSDVLGAEIPRAGHEGGI